MAPRRTQQQPRRQAPRQIARDGERTPILNQAAQGHCLPPSPNRLRTASRPRPLTTLLSSPSRAVPIEDEVDMYQEPIRRTVRPDNQVRCRRIHTRLRGKVPLSLKPTLPRAPLSFGISLSSQRPSSRRRRLASSPPTTPTSPRISPSTVSRRRCTSVTPPDK